VTGELTVSIDAMGGDQGPGIVVSALVRSAIRHPTVRFLVHGDEAELKPLFAKQPKLLPRVEIRHSPERVRMDEKPSQAARRGELPSQSHISSAGHRIASGHSCSGANAHASSAPAISAASDARGAITPAAPSGETAAEC